MLSIQGLGSLLSPGMERDDLPPADAPRPPLRDYVDLSTAAQDHIDHIGPAPPEDEPPLSYRGLLQIRLKSAPVPEAALPAPAPEEDAPRDEHDQHPGDSGVDGASDSS